MQWDMIIDVGGCHFRFLVWRHFQGQ